MESLTKEYASPVCVCMQLRKAGRVVTQIYDRCLRPVGIRGTQFALEEIRRSPKGIRKVLLAQLENCNDSDLLRFYACNKILLSKYE